MTFQNSLRYQTTKQHHHINYYALTQIIRARHFEENCRFDNLEVKNTFKMHILFDMTLF